LKKQDLGKNKKLVRGGIWEETYPSRRKFKLAKSRDKVAFI
jgi:uncharacterized protein Veg